MKQYVSISADILRISSSANLQWLDAAAVHSSQRNTIGTLLTGLQRFGF